MREKDSYVGAGGDVLGLIIRSIICSVNESLIDGHSSTKWSDTKNVLQQRVQTNKSVDKLHSLPVTDDRRSTYVYFIRTKEESI